MGAAQDITWRAVAMVPGLPELGTFQTMLECAEAAHYAQPILGAAVRCFAVVMAGGGA